MVWEAGKPLVKEPVWRGSKKIFVFMLTQGARGHILISRAGTLAKEPS
jgi:hypothetical protein